MTKTEENEIKKRTLVRSFFRENKMSAWDLAKTTKELCACGTCYYFFRHYDSEGKSLFWGHCEKGNIQHSKQMSTAACGFWRDKDE